MRRIIVVVICCVFVHEAFTQVYASYNSKLGGIKFENSSDWDQVIEKATSEGKYIFVDCYTTWCLPCKTMDKTVYSNDTVGYYVNSKFISLKVQIDTTKYDAEDVRRSYDFAHKVKNEYQIVDFPTYLFFAPDGRIVHKEVGGKSKDGFLSIVSNALNPEKQYYTLLQNYLRGKKDYETMPQLANTAKRLNNNSFAVVVARDYIDNYLLEQTGESLFTRKNISFITTFLKSTTEKGFDLIYYHEREIDSAFGLKGYTALVLEDLISKDFITPEIEKAKKDNVNPDWDKYYKVIKIKYNGNIAYRAILNEKINWYLFKEDWKYYTKYLVEQVEKYGVINNIADVRLNNYAFEIFSKSNNRKELRAAISWVDKAIKMSDKVDPNILDTKANLLYKLGYKKEAILLEEQAASTNHPQKEDFQRNLEKMKKGEATWL